MLVGERLYDYYVIELTPEHEVIVINGSLKLYSELCVVIMIEYITKYKCKNCHGDIIYGNRYKRYYCCYNCFISHRTRTCLICGKKFLDEQKYTRFCSSCINMGEGLTHHELRNTYRTMLHRCYNPERNGHESYSDKNITVCKEWHNFETFVRDMHPRPNNTTLDRIDNNKGYSKENCRWALIGEQRINRNRFKNATYTYKGVCPHGQKWKSKIRHNGINYYLGLFLTEYDAAVAYDKKVKEFYPDTYKAYLNIKE